MSSVPPIAADAPNVVWAIDKPAYTRLPAGLDAEAWVDRIDRCLVRISTVTRLEIGYTFRAGEQARIEPTAPPLTMMPVEYLTRPSRTAPSKCRCCSPIVVNTMHWRFRTGW